MVCRTEVVDSAIYNYCPDDLPAVADRMQSIMHGRFIDELTGLGMERELSVTSDVDHVLNRAASSGMCGLVANPARRFPGLAANTVEINMSVTANRYVPQTFYGGLGPFNTGIGSPADYPDFFAPINIGTVGLHRAASIIKGRCVQNNGVSRVPLDNVTVALLGVWHQFPAANVDPLAVVETPNIISLEQSLYRQRTAGVDQVRQRDLNPRLGEEKVLRLPVAAGARQLRVSNRVNLAVGNLLAIDFNHADLLEYIEVVAIDGATTAEQPAVVSLAYPLKKEHREGITVVRVDPQPPATNNTLTRDAIQGDQSVFLNALTDITDSTIELFGAGTPEYHQARLYNVLSDAEGYFSLPPISRVGMMQLRASRADLLNTADMIFSPNYELLENRIDLIFG